MHNNTLGPISDSAREFLSNLGRQDFSQATIERLASFFSDSVF